MRNCAMAVVLIFVSSLAADDKNLRVISPADAGKHVNQKCIVEMEVKSTGKSNDAKWIYLNSEENFRDKANFGVVIDGKVAEKLKEAKIPDPRMYYLKKRIRVTGTIELYKDRPQIRPDAPEQIQVVEGKK